MAGDINVHSFIWNFYYYRKQNVTIFKDFIEKFRLLNNNKPRRATRFSSREVSIIDFALLLLQFGFLTLWIISEKYLSLFDFKLIVLR